MFEDKKRKSKLDATGDFKITKNRKPTKNSFRFFFVGVLVLKKKKKGKERKGKKQQHHQQQQQNEHKCLDIFFMLHRQRLVCSVAVTDLLGRVCDFFCPKVYFFLP